LRPRREDAPTEAGLPRRRGRGDDAAEAEREGRRDDLDIAGEPDEADIDVSLVPLARALLALAEQLRHEEGS
jgi:hypothetical protein